MASIFTWESDTPRVSSPWLLAEDIDENGASLSKQDESAKLTVPRQRQLRAVRRLQAEPQEGPVEYKLHLLLRPRRHFSFTSTGNHISGSSRAAYSLEVAGRTMSESILSTSKVEAGATPTVSSSTMSTRQHRLQQLTTQLLWRLQQSSPHHTSSATNIIFPALPDSSHELAPPQKPGKLLHGLEESQGALYEIGVSDDGTLIGLAEDELNESLNNLRAMAACLGCTVEVLRKEIVGECRWSDTDRLRKSPLYVAEAFIKPCLQSQSPLVPDSHLAQTVEPTENLSNLMLVTAEQLRITLTGATMSGKSSLLGTLTTSTLDTGRGKSRLGMLKHRHEINTGITSSVTQELIGYQDLPNGNVEVVNYAAANVASWVDIHAASADNRVVFISDTAGHPRYRRTTIRSLIGWAPHWTLLCIPANDGQTLEPASGIADTASLDAVDLTGAQLDLCLKLELPLIIVITKLDLASRSMLRTTLSRLLDTLKASNRRPSIFPNDPAPATMEISEMIKSALVDKACNVVVPLLNDPLGTVPIVLTSAVQGTGMSNLHALLHELPIPDEHKADRSAKTVIFHVEDVYSKADEGITTTILGGHVRSGEIEVGSDYVLGPFTMHDQMEDSEDSDERPTRRNSRGRLPMSRSFPGALPDIGRFAVPGQEWKQYRITSIRNLRLPVHALSAGQVGTVGITAVSEAGPATESRIRKGMILTLVQPATARTFSVQFQRAVFDSSAIGSHVILYTASIRAAAKVISATSSEIAHEPQVPPLTTFDFDEDVVAEAVQASDVLVTFTFEASREYIVVGDKILVMPGGGALLFAGEKRGTKGLAGLDGHVGSIAEILS